MARAGANTTGTAARGPMQEARAVGRARLKESKDARRVRNGGGRSRAGTTFKRNGRTYMYVPTGAGRTTMPVQVRGRRGRAATTVATRRRTPS